MAFGKEMAIPEDVQMLVNGMFKIHRGNSYTRRLKTKDYIR